MSEDTHQTSEHMNENEIKESLAVLNNPKTTEPEDNQMFKLAVGVTVGLILGVLGTWIVMKQLQIPEPPKFYMLIYREDVENPYTVPIRDNLNWFLPVGTNPPVIRAVKLARPDEVKW